MTLRDNMNVSARYRALVEAGKIEEDGAQKRLARLLDDLLQRIGEKRVSRKSSSLGWLFARKAPQQTTDPTNGLYVFGAVGRGKTMLMDLFFEAVPARRKRRAHFNEFMQDAHNRIHAYRQKVKAGEVKDTDPIPPVAADLLDDAWVLCFDEFSVTDITDAMILSRLFTELFAKGCVLVATSNVAPDDLYRDGLNRDLFLPFVELLKARTQIFNLDARTDYRLEKTAKLPVYSSPLGADSARAMDDAWKTIAGGSTGQADSLTIKGHKVDIPRAVDGAARFNFSDLCSKPLGAADYLALAGRFDTILIDGIPSFSERSRNEAKRFIALIDTLYDQKVRLIASAAAAPEELMTTRRGNEGFEFDRTASRLIEMQSEDYLDASKARQR